MFIDFIGKNHEGQTPGFFGSRTVQEFLTWLPLQVELLLRVAFGTRPSGRGSVSGSVLRSCHDAAIVLGVDHRFTLTFLFDLLPPANPLSSFLAVAEGLTVHHSGAAGRWCSYAQHGCTMFCCAQVFHESCDMRRRRKHTNPVPFVKARPRHVTRCSSTAKYNSANFSRRQFLDWHETSPVSIGFRLEKPCPF